MRGHIGSALSHIEYGVKMVSESISQKDKTSIYTPLSTLSLLFVRLDAQVSQIVRGNTRRLTSPALDCKEIGYQPDIPPEFFNLEEARNGLDYIWTACVRSIQGVPSGDWGLIGLEGPRKGLSFSLDLIKNSCVMRLNQWSTAFAAFLQQHDGPFSAVDKRTIHTLEMHRIVTRVILTADYIRAQHDETVWDDFIPEFEGLLRHAKAFMDLLGDDETPPFTLSLDTGIILPLSSLIHKCRVSSIRHDALSILRSRYWQEGLASSKMSAVIGSRVVEIEESASPNPQTCEDIPHWARLTGLGIVFDEMEKRANIEYFVCKSPNSFARVMITEQLSL
jgi:hypothetical protein